MRPRSLIALLAAAALVAGGLVAPIGGDAAQPTAEVAKKKGKKCKSKRTAKVKVGDDFFSPSKLKVKKCTKVKWKWLKTNFNPHNVTLTKGPKKVKKKDFKSVTGAVGVKFNRVLQKKGKYKFVCTIHSTVMRQTINVKK